MNDREFERCTMHIPWSGDRCTNRGVAVGERCHLHTPPRKSSWIVDTWRRVVDAWHARITGSEAATRPGGKHG